MILYTMMPQEFIFPDDQEAFSKQQTIIYNGVPLLVEQIDVQTLQVVRLLSSNPQHFLDVRYSPGAKISLYH